MLEGFGAKVVLVDQDDGKPGMVTGKDVLKAEIEANRLSLEIGAYYVDQFNNEGSILGHYKTTGPEIYGDTNGKIDCFVAAIGSAGTFVGVSKYLKEQNRKIKCIGVEPANAMILAGKKVLDSKHLI